MIQAIPIVTPEGVTPAWMTAALRSAGLDVTVSSVSMTSDGTGQLGETRRFQLEYGGTIPANAPSSVVGKFPSANEKAAETGRTMGFYRSEVMFYRQAAQRARIHVPATYVAEINEQNDFTLLFEDMAPAQQGDQMRGCTVDEARRALSEAAKLHAAFWNDVELAKQPWLYVPETAQGFYTTELIERSWDYFKREYRGMLEPAVHEVCDRYVRNHAHWNRPRPSPKCYTHCDLRPDNMLFRPDGGRVCIVDWQTSNFLGTGMDTAYFLGGCFDRETRRSNERSLLKGYHEQLCENGVTGYSLAQAYDDYRHYSFAVLAVAIAATVIVKRTDRGDQLFVHMIKGGAYQAIDNEALDLLPH